MTFSTVLLEIYAEAKIWCSICQLQIEMEIELWVVAQVMGSRTASPLVNKDTKTGGDSQVKTQQEWRTQEEEQDLLMLGLWGDKSHGVPLEGIISSSFLCYCTKNECGMRHLWFCRRKTKAKTVEKPGLAACEWSVWEVKAGTCWLTGAAVRGVPTLEASGIGSVTARVSWMVSLGSFLNIYFKSLNLFSTSGKLIFSLFISLLSLHTLSCGRCLFLSASPVLPHLFRWKENGLQSLVSLEGYQGFTQCRANISLC